MPDAPRDDLIRSTPLRVARVDGDAVVAGLLRADGDDEQGLGTMVGYPIVFNAWTEIDSWEGRFLERVSSGAVSKTLEERGDRVVVLFNHGFDPQIGDKPLGRPSLMEPRSRGMYAEVPLSDTSYNRDLRALIDDGALYGQSFRFSVVREEWNEPKAATADNPDRLPERTIKEIRLYEFGPVTYPAYEATTLGIRSRDAFRLWQNTPPEQRAKLLEGTTRGATPPPPEAPAPDAPAPEATRRESAADAPPDEGHPSHPPRPRLTREFRRLSADARREWL
ncbi:MAG TPA: HK97 family phage prohead protease, partial [Acidimicrobiales bacterium]